MELDRLSLVCAWRPYTQGVELTPSTLASTIHIHQSNSHLGFSGGGIGRHSRDISGLVACLPEYETIYAVQATNDVLHG